MFNSNNSAFSPAPSGANRADRGHVWVWALATLWLAGVAYGLRIVWTYENTPGTAATAPQQWPRNTTLAPATDRPTLVFVAHPQCTCTHASLEELREALAHTDTPPRTYVLFLRPAMFKDGWEETDLWRQAQALPGVTVVRDADGGEARRFGVETSGQTLLYDRRGTLVFSGGITGSRGHAGDNAGEAALVSYLTRGDADRAATRVFGCPLFAQGT